MQLKLRRSQREGGIVGRTVIFCLDARVEFTAKERRNIAKYKLQNEIIYNSQAHQNAAAASTIAAASAKAQSIQYHSHDSFLESATSKMGYGLKAAAMGAVAAMRLRISIASLERGQRIECKDLNELLGAEDAIMTACRNLWAYLDTASNFDGQQAVYDFENGTPMLVAVSEAPAAELIAPSTSLPSQALALPPPAFEEGVSGELEPERLSYNPYSSTSDPLDAMLGYWNDPVWRPRIVIGIIALLVIILLLR